MSDLRTHEHPLFTGVHVGLEFYEFLCTQDTGSWDTAKRRRSFSWTPECAFMQYANPPGVASHLCDLRSYLVHSIEPSPGPLQGGRGCAWGTRGVGVVFEVDQNYTSDLRHLTTPVPLPPRPSLGIPRAKTRTAGAKPGRLSARRGYALARVRPSRLEPPLPAVPVYCDFEGLLV